MNNMDMGPGYDEYGRWVLQHHHGAVKLAEFLNALIGLWYALFALIFVAAAYVVIRSYIQPRYRPGMRKTDAPGVFYREAPKVPPLGWGVIVPFYLGSMSFFVGCGLHHWVIAFGELPGGHSGMWHSHHLVMAWFQALGAPLAGFAALRILMTFRDALRDSEAEEVYHRAERRAEDAHRDSSP